MGEQPVNSLSFSLRNPLWVTAAMAAYVTRACPVRRATSQAEREAVFRLRYRVYVQELGKQHVLGANHHLKEIHDPEDERGNSEIFYVGEPGRPTGTLRVDIYHAGEVTEDVRRRFCLDRFPEFKGEAVCESARFVVDRASRGSVVAMALAIAGFRRTVMERGVRVGFGYAAPGLVHAYRKLGLRPYCAGLIPTADGLRVPLISIHSDIAYLRAVGSPLASIVAEAFGPGRHAPFDITRLRDRIGHRVAPFSTDAIEVRAALQTLHDHNAPVVASLSSKALNLIAKQGAIVRVNAGDQMLRAGLVDRELFVVVEGRLAAKDGSKTIAEMGLGEPIGEVALFADTGRRSADVIALEPSRLLLVGRNVIDRLLRDEPHIGGRLLVNLARVMAGRLTGNVSSLAERRFY